MLPKNLKLKPNERDASVLAHGEVTGHRHAIYTPKRVKHFESKDINETRQWLQVLEDVEIKHEEHSTVKLPAGSYEIRIQNQYIMGKLERAAD